MRAATASSPSSAPSISPGDLKHERKVALKVLKPRWSADGIALFYRNLIRDTVFAARLQTEPSVSVVGANVAWVTPNASGPGPWAFDASSGRGIIAQVADEAAAEEDERVTVVVN